MSGIGGRGMERVAVIFFFDFFFLLFGSTNQSQISEVS